MNLNPYQQSPNRQLPNQQYPYRNPGDVRAMQLAAAKKRLFGPGLALSVLSSFGLLFIYYVFFVVDWNRHFGMATVQDGILHGFVASIFWVANLAILLAGIFMMQRISYSSTRIGAILACIPLLSPFLILGIPFGIWALVVLNRPDIKAAFQS
jgi:hypothetical protein